MEMTEGGINTPKKKRKRENSKEKTNEKRGKGKTEEMIKINTVSS